MSIRSRETSDSPFRFPCEFPIKVLGRCEEDFELLVVESVLRYTPDLGEGAIKTRASRKGNYLAVTVTINAVSREQLDAIYHDLSRNERVIMAL